MIHLPTIDTNSRSQTLRNVNLDLTGGIDYVLGNITSYNGGVY